MVKKPLKNKKILITAGPVWIPIDKVRVMTNIFGGSLGLVVASKAQKKGAKVVLLLGPGRVQVPEKIPSALKIIRFKYFNELLNLMEKEISSKKYDIVVHSAAVADYTPDVIHKYKIKSGKKEFIVRFKPTLKIVDLIKKWDPSVFLVKFKLEVGLKKKQLIDRAYKSMLNSKADLIVANDLKKMQKNKYLGFIIDVQRRIQEVHSREILAEKLFKIIISK